MEFTLQESFDILERTPAVLEHLLGGLSDRWTSRNQGGETWSVYDIIGHLIHGEKTDWVTRAEIILSDNPDKTFPKFDRFAQFEESKGKPLSQILAEFKEVRGENLQTIRSRNLSPADLDLKGIHPAFGAVTMSQLLATWAVHDLNHLAQIARVMAFQYKSAVGPWVEYLRILQ